MREILIDIERWREEGKTVAIATVQTSNHWIGGLPFLSPTGRRQRGKMLLLRPSQPGNVGLCVFFEAAGSGPWLCPGSDLGLRRSLYRHPVG